MRLLPLIAAMIVACPLMAQGGRGHGLNLFRRADKDLARALRRAARRAGVREEPCSRRSRRDEDGHRLPGCFRWFKDRAQREGAKMGQKY